MRYGVPYQGSKNSIAREIVEFLPSADTLIDICAGGCAVTHAALELCEGFVPKWNHIISNDINPMPGRLFRDAMAGKYANETRWISREDFFRLKDADAYVRYIWSFANAGKEYMYSREREPWMRAVHHARVLGDRGPMREFGIESDGSRADIDAHEAIYRDKYIRWYLWRMTDSEQDIDEIIAQTREDVEKTEEELRAYLIDALHKSGLTQAEVQRRLGTQMANHYFGKSQWEFPTREMYGKMQEFMPLESPYDEIVGLYRLRKRLQSLQSLQSMKMLNQTVLSYEQVQIPDHAVIYADIPYEGTSCDAYDGFDHQKFYDWVAQQRVPVFISSYEISDPRFVCVWQRGKRCLIQSGSGALRTERIYTQRGSIA